MKMYSLNIRIIFFFFLKMSALKVQMQSDSAIIDRLEQEKAQAFGIVGNLKATITGLEGQVRKNSSVAGWCFTWG